MITKIEEIKKSSIKEVEICGFEEGEKITLGLRRICLMDLISKGKIPNSLMSVAVNLFSGKSGANSIKTPEEQAKYFQDFNETLDIICENVIVEPSYEELKPYLLDDQKMEIYFYAEGGLRQVERFREQQANIKRNLNGKQFSEITE